MHRWIDFDESYLSAGGYYRSPYAHQSPRKCQTSSRKIKNGKAEYMRLQANVLLIFSSSLDHAHYTQISLTNRILYNTHCFELNHWKHFNKKNSINTVSENVVCLFIQLLEKKPSTYPNLFSRLNYMLFFVAGSVFPTKNISQTPRFILISIYSLCDKVFVFG